MTSGRDDKSKKIRQTDPTALLSSEELLQFSKKHLEECAPDDGGVLLLLDASKGNRQFDIDAKTMCIGRGADSEICLEAEGVSRRHALIKQGSGGVFVEDLGSTNGTLVNNERISEPVQLEEDDLVQVGAVVFKYLPPGCQELAFLRSQDAAARTDPLTQIANKRCLQETLESAFDRSRKYGDKLSMIILDIDHFKQVNDTYGHDAGDVVLKTLAKRLADKAVRQADLLGRYGGEEFVVILPGAGMAQAKKVGERVRVVVEAEPFPYAEKSLDITVSCGVASYLPEYDSATALLKAADGALYEAKTSGRNRVCAAEQD